MSLNDTFINIFQSLDKILDKILKLNFLYRAVESVTNNNYQIVPKFQDLYASVTPLVNEIAYFPPSNLVLIKDIHQMTLFRRLINPTSGAVHKFDYHLAIG